MEKCQPIRCLGYELAPSLASLNYQSQNVNKNSWRVLLYKVANRMKKEWNITPKNKLQLWEELSVGYYIALLNICTRYSSCQMFIHGKHTSSLTPLNFVYSSF